MLLTGAAIASLSAGAAHAAGRHFDLPAGDAAQTVQSLAQDTGLQVLAPSADLRGVRTNPVNGDYSPIEALRKMLAGTPLEVIQNPNGAITVRRANAVGQADTSEPAAPPEDVIVTGSRIARPGFDTLEAATSTDAAELARRGYTNVLEALQATPGFGPAANSQIGTSQGNLGIAQSYADFFGLGSQRTLTLVNGRRFVSSNTVSGAGSAVSPGSQVDLNMIPVGLIDHIETVAIGGAPVYGSDAIAGTVNIILKNKYQGFELTGQTSISSRGDAANQSVHALAGRNFADGRGNIVIAGEYTKQSGMVLANRFPFRYLVPSGNTNPSDGISSQMVVNALHYAPLTPGGLPYTAAVPYPATYIKDSSGNPLAFDPNGNLTLFNPGTAFFQSASGPIPIFGDGGDGLDPARYTSLLSPNERYVFNANANFDVTDHINLFVEGTYAHTSGTKISDLFQFAAPGILGGPSISININNPFLNAQAKQILQANGVTGNFLLNRNLNDIVDRFPATNSTDLYRIVAGLKGDFKVGGESWNWDVSYNYGHSRNYAVFNQINLTRFQAATNAVRDGSGNIVCASGGACVPLNLFGEGAASDAAVNYVIDHGIGVSTNVMEDVQANLGGKFGFGIAGPISFSVGYEHRRESGNFEGNDIINAGLSLLGGGAAFPDATNNGFHTNEVYGEAVVPLLNDGMHLPLIKDLQFEGKARYVDHSVSGGDITWAAGGRLNTRLPGLLLRGVYTRAIRTPSIVELFLNSTPVAGSANDVCAATRANTGPNPTVRLANCTAALAAAGGPAPAAFVPTTNGASPFGVSGGNPNLNNEIADSYSFGLVYQPPGTKFHASIDYSHIKVANAISNFGLGTAQAACYDSPNYPNEGACNAFHRLTVAEAAAQTAATGRARIAGDIADGYQESYFNTAKIEFAGIIGQVNYAFGVPNLAGRGRGELRLGATAFYIDKFDTQTSGGAPLIRQAGTLGTPRWNVTGSVGYNFDPFDLDVQLLWTSKTVGDRSLTIEDTPINDYPAYTRINATLGFNINDRFGLDFVVRNLFDAGVPFSAQVSRAFGVYDPIGRTFTARATVKF
jgi:outer membrane receptor protein involved in Fe transport